MEIVEMTEAMAKDVVSWKYEGEYSIYNYPTWDNIYNTYSIAKDGERENEFFAILKDGEIIGHFRVKVYEDFFLLGLGFKPEYCGKGQGKENVKLIVDFVEKLGAKIIRLEVRDFNLRAIKVYSRNGFYPIDVVKRQTFDGIGTFIVMERETII